jgi:putative transposase
MPRQPRHTPGGFVYHVLNRGTARLVLFRKPADYDAFQRVLEEALQKYPTRLLAYCVMPSHWHFVLWPEQDGQLTQLLRWLTLTHSVRWQTQRHARGSGHVYQNRFKAFPVQDDEHLYRVIRYVERNPVRANLVHRAEDWLWSSLGARTANSPAAGLLHPWPIAMPRDWRRLVNEPQTDAELEALRCSVTRGRPYGSEQWREAVVEQLSLQTTTRPRGRPRKRPVEEGT